MLSLLEVLHRQVMGMEPASATPAVQPRGQPPAIVASCGLLLLAVLASRFWARFIPGPRQSPLLAGAAPLWLTLRL